MIRVFIPQFPGVTLECSTAKEALVLIFHDWSGQKRRRMPPLNNDPTPQGAD